MGHAEVHLCGAVSLGEGWGRGLLFPAGPTAALELAGPAEPHWLGARGLGHTPASTVIQCGIPSLPWST